MTKQQTTYFFSNYKKHRKILARGGVKQEGFTLIEMIVTIAIIGILAAIAYPSLIHYWANAEAQRVANILTTTIKTGKAESYIRHKNLYLCLLNQNGQCAQNASAALVLFVDNNRNHAFEASTDTLIERHRFNLDYARLQLHDGNHRTVVRFAGDSGLPRGYFGHISYCPTTADSHPTYQISFNQNGGIKYKTAQHYPMDC